MRSFMKIKSSRNGKCLSTLFVKIKFSRKFPNLQCCILVLMCESLSVCFIMSLGNRSNVIEEERDRCFFFYNVFWL